MAEKRISSNISNNFKNRVVVSSNKDMKTIEGESDYFFQEYSYAGKLFAQIETLKPDDVINKYNEDGSNYLKDIVGYKNCWKNSIKEFFTFSSRATINEKKAKIIKERLSYYLERLRENEKIKEVSENRELITKVTETNHALQMVLLSCYNEPNLKNVSNNYSIYSDKKKALENYLKTIPMNIKKDNKIDSIMELFSEIEVGINSRYFEFLSIFNKSICFLECIEKINKDNEKYILDEEIKKIFQILSEEKSDTEHGKYKELFTYKKLFINIVKQYHTFVKYNRNELASLIEESLPRMQGSKEFEKFLLLNDILAKFLEEKPAAIKGRSSFLDTAVEAAITSLANSVGNVSERSFIPSSAREIVHINEASVTEMVKEQISRQIIPPWDGHNCGYIALKVAGIDVCQPENTAQNGLGNSVDSNIHPNRLEFFDLGQKLLEKRVPFSCFLSSREVKDPTDTSGTFIEFSHIYDKMIEYGVFHCLGLSGGHWYNFAIVRDNFYQINFGETEPGVKLIPMFGSSPSSSSSSSIFDERWINNEQGAFYSIFFLGSASVELNYKDFTNSKAFFE